MEKYNDPGLKQFLWKKCKSIPGKNKKIGDMMGWDTFVIMKMLESTT